eukprot:4020942-Pleurochrysis_carterae.AAC.1
MLALARGRTRSPMLSSGMVSPVGRVSDACPVVAFTRSSTCDSWPVSPGSPDCAMRCQVRARS